LFRPGTAAGRQDRDERRWRKSVSNGWMEEESYLYGNGTVSDTY